MTNNKLAFIRTRCGDTLAPLSYILGKLQRGMMRTWWLHTCFGLCIAMSGNLSLSAQTRLEVSHSEILLNIPEIIGKSPSIVKRILGKPERIEFDSKSMNTPKGHIYYYNNNMLEIGFVYERVEFIYFVPPVPCPFSQMSLKKLGLPICEPTTQNRFVIRWENRFKIRDLGIFPNDDGKTISYINVIVTRDPATL